MSQHKYSSEYVAPVQPADAREFLTAVGLPNDHPLFAEAEKKQPVDAAGRLLLPVGYGEPDSPDLYCVDCLSGAVVYLVRADESVTHVSAAPRQFDDLLRVFASEITAVDDDPEDIAERLRLQIENIDPTALDEDPGFWGNVLFDVANGDYTDDED